MRDISEKELKQLYLEERLEVSEIAEELGFPHSAGIYYWLHKYNIPTRNHLQIGISHDPEWGYEMFQTNVNDNKTQIRHHRLLATLKYDLDEMKGKHIHHKNGVPWDNRLENLELIEPSEHSSLHFTEEKREAFTESRTN